MDAQRMHREHPATFDAPSEADLAGLRPGDLVKVCNKRDRFWVTLTEAQPDGTLVGVVQNRPVGKQRYGMGDGIRFHVRNVYVTQQPARPGRLSLLLASIRSLGLIHVCRITVPSGSPGPGPTRAPLGAP